MTLTFSDTIVVAAISGLFSVGAVLVNWLLQRDVRDLTSTHEREMLPLRAEHDAKLAELRAQQEAQLAQLRAELSLREETLRSQLLRDVASHESALRVNGELRLRLFEKATVAVADAFRAIHTTISSIAALARGEKADDGAAAESVAMLTHVGVFLPPELHEAFDGCRLALLLVAARLKLDRREDGYPASLSDEIYRMVAPSRAALEAAALEWRRKTWSSLQEMPHDS